MNSYSKLILPFRSAALPVATGKTPHQVLQGIGSHAHTNMRLLSDTNMNRRPHFTNQLKLVPDQSKELHETRMATQLQAGLTYVPILPLSSAFTASSRMNNPPRSSNTRQVWDHSIDDSQAYVSRAMFDTPLAIGTPSNQLNSYPREEVEDDATVVVSNQSTGATSSCERMM